MAVPKISFLEESPKAEYKCHMCKTVSRKNKYLWKSWFEDDELIICRECAYRETFGTKGMKETKRKRILEEKGINQKRN